MYISLNDLNSKAEERPPGYLDDVLSRGTVKDGMLSLSSEAYMSLLRKYNPEASVEPNVGGCCRKTSQPLDNPQPSRILPVMSQFKLSVIMTALNEGSEVEATIKSLRDTAGEEPEVIVIDDCSDVPVSVTGKNIILHRNKSRVGCAPSRHTGAQMASFSHIMLTDAHMRFDKGWYENLMEKINKRPGTVYNGACLGLWEDDMDISKCKGSYNGATLQIDDPKGEEILEGKWIPERPDEDDYELACLMGAIYIFPKNLFFELRGLNSLKMWGSDEPFLSLKTWLSGNEIRMAKNVRVGHKFRGTAPYATGVPNLIYNKLRMIKVIFDPHLGDFLIRRLKPSGNLSAALDMIKADDKAIQNEAAYYRSIFTHDVYWYAQKFGIPLPEIPKSPGLTQLSYQTNKVSQEASKILTQVNGPVGVGPRVMPGARPPIVMRPQPTFNRPPILRPVPVPYIEIPGKEDVKSKVP